MKQIYRLSFGFPGRTEHETLTFGAGSPASYQLRAAREIVRALRPVAPNVMLQVKVSDTEWMEVEVSGGSPPFDATDAQTWNENEKAVYETGHREGESCRNADLRCLLEESDEATEGLIARLWEMCS